MGTLGIYLIFAAVALRGIVVSLGEPQFLIILGLLAGYGLVLFVKTWLINQGTLAAYKSEGQPSLSRKRWQWLLFTYFLLQSGLIFGLLITSAFKDFFALLFIPLSIDAVSFFGRRVGYISIAIFSLAIIFAFLFSDEGQLFGLAMGVLYSGVYFLLGGYAYQVRKSKAALDQNEQVFNELQTTYHQLQGYTDQKASLAVEHERNHLARELHDSVTQTVFSMNLAAQSAQLLLDKEPIRAAGQLLRIEELAASALGEIQSLVSELRPRSVVEEGLPAALYRLGAEQKARNGLQVSLEIHGDGTLSETTAKCLYSIVHEALINVSKHSGSHEAIVRLNVDKGHSCMEVEDHGRGFNPEAALVKRGHLGLAGMFEQAREIGWNLSIVSRPDQGTLIRVTENPPGGLE